MISVIGVYDKFEPAQSAKNELLVAGLSWTQVQLNPDHEVTPHAKSARPHTDDPSVQANIGNLVKGLFGMGNKSSHGDLYGAAVRHADYVLIADVDTDLQRERAETIMRRHEPVDLKSRAS